MKALILCFALFLCSNLQAKDVTVNTRDVNRFEVINNRYYIVTKTAKFELYSKSQMTAIQSLIYRKNVITIKVK